MRNKFGVLIIPNFKTFYKKYNIQDRVTYAKTEINKWNRELKKKNHMFMAS